MTESQNGSSSAPAPQDGCPDWAARKLAQLCEMEIRLGNVHHESEWHTRDMGPLTGAQEGASGEVTEAMAEAVFRKIARELHEAGYSPETIASFANARIGTDQRLPYCDASEVREALSE